MPQKNNSESAPVAVLHLWEFERAPANLRRLFPSAYAGGWLAFIRPGASAELLEGLVSRVKSTEFPIVKYEIEDGGVVLAGPHLSILGP